MKSTPGVALWLTGLATATAYAIVSDLWLLRHGHRMLSTVFRDATSDPIAGPLVVGSYVGVLAGLSWHLFKGNHVPRRIHYGS